MSEETKNKEGQPTPGPTAKAQELKIVFAYSDSAQEW